MPKYIDLLRGRRNPGEPDEELLAQEDVPREEAKQEEEELLDTPAAKKTAKKRPRQSQPGGKSYLEDTSQPSEALVDEAKGLLSECTRIMFAILKAATGNKPVPISKLWQHLKPQITETIRDPKQLNALELKVSETPQHFRELSEELGGMVEKSINMLLLGIKVGLQLKMPEEAILKLVFAGMLHQVGLARVPAAIRKKSSALTKDERKVIRNSTQEGVKYLQACGSTDKDVLLAIGQSQERIDGTGPRGLQNDSISYFGRIVGLLSFFEALIHYRPYRQRLLPRDAIREIILHHKPAFDTSLLKALIDAVSLYPIGTYVQLNTGEMGRVIHVHPRLPLRPIVLLDMDDKRQPIVQRQVDLQVQTTLIIVRCMYPEDLDSEDFKQVSAP